ncbi:DegT/DnrJ/EryC1/StrS family aminotransferase [Candidatus Babeliales bacterium]|nr:DegT/DnrJ/EryC1/StrS family aminotransferase [Candidatus Babeliales bacterium]
MQLIRKNKSKKFVIPVNEPLLNGNEKKYLNECVETGWISSEGPFVKEFEKKFSSKVNRKYGVAVCNGSAALEIAVLALDLPKGSEVILPTFTIISCAIAIVRAGLIPVFVDSDSFTWNMNVNQIEKKISNKTKAIMVVHIYGLPVDMDPILNLAKKYNLKIIEDAAEVIGQKYKNKSCGSFGDVSIFSFYPNKHVTTGEGGMVVTDNEYITERCRSLRNLCFNSKKRFVHYELGFNFRMTNIQAAIGLAQLERLDEFIIKKRFIGEFYTEALKEINSIQLPLGKTDYAQNIYWVYGLVLKDNFDLCEIIKKLSEEKIGTRPFFWCMHEQPIFIKKGFFKGEKYPVAQKLARKGFYIPSGLSLNLCQMERVVEVLRKILK